MKAFIFTSPRCGPCQRIKPMLSDLYEEFSTVEWKVVDIMVDKSGAVETYEIRSVPTLVVDNGKEVQKVVGADIQAYYRLLQKMSKQ